MTKPRQHTKATISDIPSVNYSQPFAVLATANRKLHFEELPDHRKNYKFIPAHSFSKIINTIVLIFDEYDLLYRSV